MACEASATDYRRSITAKGFPILAVRKASHLSLNPYPVKNMENIITAAVSEIVTTESEDKRLYLADPQILATSPDRSFGNILYFNLPQK